MSPYSLISRILHGKSGMLLYSSGITRSPRKIKTGLFDSRKGVSFDAWGLATFNKKSSIIRFEIVTAKLRFRYDPGQKWRAFRLPGMKGIDQIIALTGPREVRGSPSTTRTLTLSLIFRGK